jgi:hypothetical protein
MAMTLQLLHGTLSSLSSLPSTGYKGVVALTTDTNQVFIDQGSGTPGYGNPGSGKAWILAQAGGGTGGGTVTDVAMEGDGVIFNSIVSGSPITTYGTLVPSLLAQGARTFLAGPQSAPSSTPTFRLIALGDLPSPIDAGTF